MKTSYKRINSSIDTNPTVTAVKVTIFRGFVAAYMTAVFALCVFLAGCGGGGAGSDPFAPSGGSGSLSPERGTVSNVRISGSGSSVAVTYDLNGADTCGVRLFYSTDGGATFIESFDISGDTAEVAPGYDRRLIWSGASVLAAASAAGLKVRVSARGPAGAEAFSDSVAFETRKPSQAVSGRIVFHSERDVSRQIYVMNADGSSLCRLSDGRSSDFNPRFSPDGSKIVFLSDRGGLYNALFIMNSDGSGVRNLSTLECESAAFTPDGGTVIFSAYKPGKIYSSLFGVSPDGSNSRSFDAYERKFTGVKSLSVSPDGAVVSFVSSNGIYRATIEGVAPSSPVFKAEDTDIKSVCYSPDGSKLLFVSYGVIYTINADGSGRAPLSSAMFATEACYSHDGKAVIFSSRASTSSTSLIYSLDPLSGEISSPPEYAGSNDFSPSMAPGSITGVVVPKVLQEIKIGSFDICWPVFDLRKIECRAIYSDGSSFKISPAWSLVSGGGSVADGVFTASEGSSRAVIGAEYSEGGVTKKAEIVLNNASGDVSGKIYFASRKNSANTEIFSVYPDGQGVMKVLGNQMEWAADPSVSPDGKRVAFTAMVDGNGELFIDEIETGRRTRITKNSYNDQDPSFSPDGKYLLYTTWKDGNSNIYRMQLPSSYGYEFTASYNTALDSNTGFDFMPSYHPGGKFVIFNSYRGGKYEIFVCQDYYYKHTRKLFDGEQTYDDMHPKFSPDGKFVIFSSNRSGKFNLYRAPVAVAASPYDPPDSTDPIVSVTGPVERLTEGAFNDTLPQYSPDGGRIVFISDRSGRDEVYIADAASLSMPVRLTTGAVLREDDFVCWACFSADGRSVLFTSRQAGKPFEIFSVSVDGAALKKIVRCACDYVNPAISKDGRAIACDSDEFSTGVFETNNFESYENREYRTIHASFYDLSVRKLLRPSSSKTASPYFSGLTDGKLVYSAFDDGVFGIKTFTSSNFSSIATLVEDSSYVYMTGTDNDNYSPCYSPDDRLVAFASPRDGGMQVYTMDASGNFQKKLTTAGTNRDPKFSPDGKKIVFTSTRDGNEEIYIMDAGGGGQTRLTNNLYNDNSPCFSPAGKILFCSYPFGGPELHLIEADGRGETVFYRDYAVSPVWK